MEFRGENGAAGHPVGPNTNEMPTPAYFRKATSKGASYTESLGKSRATIRTLGGARRVKRLAEEATQTPFRPTQAEVKGMSGE